MNILRAVATVVLLALSVGLGVPLQVLCSGFGAAADHRSMTWFCRLLLRLLRVRVEAGTPSAPGRLVVANHVSWIDALALRSIEPLSFTAKREVGTWPLVATVARLQHTIFIDRKRKRQIPRANRQMAAQLNAHRSVLLFPEGTTYDGRGRGRFLTSHLACLADALRDGPDRPSVGVEAVGIAYSDPGAAWVGDASLLPHVWSILVGPPMTCRLAYGGVLDVEPGYDRKVLGRRLADAVDRLVLEGETASFGSSQAPGLFEGRRPSASSIAP